MGRMELIKPASLPRLLKRPGLYSDGACLCLKVKESGAASWVLRYMRGGRAREMGLGSYNAIGLSKARERAREAREQLADGIDPIDHRKLVRAKQRVEAAKALTFKECGEAYIASHRDGWRNAKHGDQWASTLEAYAYPIIGDLPVAAIDTGLVMSVLEQNVGDVPGIPQRFWVAKNETASRVRGRIEAILGWAAARQLRSGDNPARWKSHLEHQLPAKSKVAKVKHHPALPYDEIGSFMAALREQPGLAASALELTILTAVRTGTTIGAKWAEFDLKAKVWIIPGSRMKMGKEHRVPLSEPVVSLLETLRADAKDVNSSLFVFPGAKSGSSLSNMAMLKLLKRMHRSGITTHGFRSTFTDWAAECTDHPREITEMALAHTVEGVEGAYRRGDLFEKRRLLMSDWAAYCAKLPPIKGAAKANLARAVRRAKLKRQLAA